MSGFKSCVVQQLRQLYVGVVGGVVRHYASMHMLFEGAGSRQQQESFV